MVTLSGKFVYEDNTAVANGILVLTLSQPCVISGTAQIVPLVKVIQLDATGAIPAATQVYGNDAMTPSGTVYTAALYTGILNSATGLYSTGAQLFSLQWSLTGASVDVSTLAPTTNGASYVSPVTSIGLTMPGEFSVSGSPVTSAGTFVVSKVNQSANQVYAGPTSGGAAAPGFRNLVDADIPATLANHILSNPTSTGTDSGTETLKNKTLNGPSNGNAVSLLNIQGATAPSTGTSANKVLFTYTIPANTLANGKVIRAKVALFHNSGTASIAYNWRLNSSVVTAQNNMTTNAAEIWWEIYILGAASGSVQVAGMGQNSNTATSGNNITQQGALAVDFTTSVTLDFVFNVANTDSVVGELFIVEILN